MLATRYFIGIVILILSVRCEKGEISALQDPMLEVPNHFPNPIYDFSSNPLKQEVIDLGKELFYDKLLSIDNSVSCASCHHQHAAFSDPGLPFSFGVDNRIGNRNSPPLFNLAWHPSFMWDGGINHIEIMPLAPITDPNEMDMEMNALIEKLNNIPKYKYLFDQAFGNEHFTDYELFLALAQFMGTMVSAYSKYDRYIAGSASLSSEEQEGLELFRQHCAACHTEPLFSDFDFHNNGLDTEFTDEGRYLITMIQSDKGKFKTPSLRNIELTFPYMHDGRFETLEEVLDHYRMGVQLSSTLSPILQNGINITDAESQKIIRFLYTLTDYAFINNTRFGKP